MPAASSERRSRRRYTIFWCGCNFERMPRIIAAISRAYRSCPSGPAASRSSGLRPASRQRNSSRTKNRSTVDPHPDSLTASISSPPATTAQVDPGGAERLTSSAGTPGAEPRADPRSIRPREGRSVPSRASARGRPRGSGSRDALGPADGRHVTGGSPEGADDRPGGSQQRYIDDRSSRTTRTRPALHSSGSAHSPSSQPVSGPARISPSTAPGGSVAPGTSPPDPGIRTSAPPSCHCAHLRWSPCRRRHGDFWDAQARGRPVSTSSGAAGRS